ncbi:MAG: cache and HAMP domain-containing protein, partial [Cyanobacteria bacterium J06639_1]
MKVASLSDRDRPVRGISPPLRRALVFPLVWQIVIAVGVAGGVAFWSYQRAADDLSEQISHEVAASVRERISALTETPHRFLRINKAAFATENLSLDNLPRLQNFFWRQVQIDDAVDTFYFSDTDGRFLLVRADELRLVYVQEERLQRRIYQLDETGNRLDLIARDTYDPRLRPWYRAAIASEAATWSPIYTFSAFPELGISPSIPLYNDAGDLQGVMAVDISLKQLDDFLAALDLGHSGTVYVVEPNGKIVASSAVEPPYSITKNGRERLHATQSVDPLVRATATHLIETYGGFDRVAEDLQFHASSAGRAYFTQVTRIRDGRGLDWLAIVAIPRTDLMQPFYRSAYLALSICAGIAIASIAFGIWQARRIARPILNLSRTADEISAGSASGSGHAGDRPVAGGSIAEIDVLASAFDRMVQRLQRSLAEAAQLNRTLEVRVRDRTADLEQAK